MALSVVIGTRGQVLSWRTAQNSGFPRLDTAAQCVLDRLKFNAGHEDGRGVVAEVLLAVVFRLD
jgi:outer membrane biosynthesis protein TonB